MSFIYNDLIDSLKDLYNVNYSSFQEGLRDCLSSFDNLDYSDDFFNILNYFRSEFIVSSYLYIFEINYFLDIFLSGGKLDRQGLLPDLIFISSIGNAATVDILKQYLLHFTGRDNILLSDAIVSLEKRLFDIEDGVEGLIFHPTMGIEASWE